MIPFRSIFPIALVLVATGAAGCKEDPPPAKPEPATSAVDKGKLNLKTPNAPMAKVDPQSMKEYRVDVCYFGTLTLKQAREAYLASLGKDEPSEKKIPNFGASAAPPPGPAIVPPGAAKDKPGAPGAAAPKPAAAPTGKEAAGQKPATPAKPGDPAGAKPKPDEKKPPFNFAMRAPHERNARACTVAVGLKDPPMPEIDGALAEYAPFAVELAKNIAAANNYYQREEYKKDEFAKGKELHKKLLADFEKLDAMSDKLGTAVIAWHKAHPPDVAKAEEGQKVALGAIEDGRATMLALLDKKVDPAAVKAALQKLEASTEAVKTFGTANQADPWAKITSPALDAFVKAVKDAEPKLTEKGISDPDVFLTVVTSFTSLVEAKHRALSRSLIAKGQTQPRQINMPPGRPPAGDQKVPAQAPKPAEGEQGEHDGHNH